VPTLLPRFTIDQPETLSEASELLRGYGEEGCAYAGGTELLLAMKQGGLRFGHLVDLKTIPGLGAIQPFDTGLRIGALATHLTIERSPLVVERVPIVAQMERCVANVRVRATGTLGGNLCFGEPHSDPATLLLCLDAQLHTTERDLHLNELLVGAYETGLESGELLESVTIAGLSPTQRASYQKFQVHEYPMLGLALVLDLDQRAEQVLEARVAVGSVSPTPRRCATAEALLLGETGGVRTRLSQAADALADDAELISDLEGSADYKRHLIHVFLERAWAQALDTTA
jgi:aerobic carbon-monoxide dehydrogenase medium subunit